MGCGLAKHARVGAGVVSFPLPLPTNQWLRANYSHEMIDAVKSADPYVFKARASAQPPMGWRTKDSKAGIPELGHPRIWLMGDAIHAMLPTRYELW